jgi:hypothetical protein
MCSSVAFRGVCGPRGVTLALNSTSFTLRTCTTLNTHVNPLIGLSTKPPKPTREISISPFLVIDGNTNKAYIRLKIKAQI